MQYFSVKNLLGCAQQCFPGPVLADAGWVHNINKENIFACHKVLQYDYEANEELRVESLPIDQPVKTQVTASFVFL